MSAAITVIPGAVIAPGLDGVIHAYDEITGKEIWQFNTRGPFAGVNVSGDKHARVAKGGTLDGGGVIVADGLMLVNSGYGGIISAGGMEGNTFLVLSLAGGQTAQSPVE